MRKVRQTRKSQWEDPRPYLESPRKQNQFLKAIETGLPMRVVCGLYGLLPLTVESWLRTGRDKAKELDAGLEEKTLSVHEHLCVQFFKAVEVSRAAVSSKVLGMLAKAISEGDTRVAMWWFERMGYRKYVLEADAAEGIQVPGGATVLTRKDGTAVQITVTEMPAEQTPAD